MCAPAATVVLAALVLAAVSAGATTVPPGFQDQLVASGLSEPAVLAFAPDGRLFVGEKSSGKIRVVGAAPNATLLPAPFVDLHDVDPATYFDAYWERGLLGIAFDPAFATNGFVYVYYTACIEPVLGGCAAGETKNRIIRLTALGDVADGAPPVVILDGIDSDAGNHNAGWIDFGPVDGALYVATGDGGQFHEKSQDLQSLSGKILRIASDGSVPPDNPYAGSPIARGEVWASGLRNPWRCRFRADGRLLCGDVGQDTWEEVDVVFPTANYGWPTTEGPFTLAEHPEFTPPIHAYVHQGGGAAIMAGDFGAKTAFPGDFQDSWFFGDYVLGVIRRVVLDATGTAVVGDAQPFATAIDGNALTDIVAGPDGALYYTRLTAGEVRRIFLVPGNHAPVAVASAENAAGPAPLTVTFSSAGSSDEDGDPLTFSWDFGDGSPTVIDPSPEHEYATRGPYVATLTVSDGKPAPGPGTATVAIAVGSAPVVTITEPLDGTPFVAGEEFALAATVTDAEDGVAAPAAVDWKVVFHHADHTHPFIDHVTTYPPTFTTADVGETSPDVGYEIVATATDSDGLTGSASVFLVATLVDLTFETSPPGLDVTLDGAPQTTPFVVTTVVGMQRSIGAPAQTGHAFASWSDGGAETHGIVAPSGDTTLTAVFDAANATPAATFTPVATTAATSTPLATPTATVTASVTPTASPTPSGLADADAARAADQCQRAITAGTVTFTKTTLGALGRCVNAVQLCVQSRPDDPRCLPKARAACLGALDDVAAAEAKMQTGIVKRCPRADDVTAALGLGYAALALACTAHGDVANDVSGLAACLAKRHRCTAERTFQLEAPRVGELFAAAGVPLPAASCLENRGGSGVGAGTAMAKAVGKCSAAVTKAATAFVTARTDAFADCGTALFTCAERKAPPDAPACFAKASAVCDHAADDARATDKLHRAIDARCAETELPYAVLRSSTAAFIDGIAADCAAEGVADVGTLGAWEACIVHQHACRAGELVRRAVPRLSELLAAVGRTLPPADCPPAAAQPQ